MSSPVTKIIDRINRAPKSFVWSPTDFVDLGKRDAVDKSHYAQNFLLVLLALKCYPCLRYGPFKFTGVIKKYGNIFLIAAGSSLSASSPWK